MEQKLEKCPFCGGNAIRIQTEASEVCNRRFERVDKEVRYRVFCNYCGCGTACEDLEDAIYDWNRRDYR